jgi:hypothetical protein
VNNSLNASSVSLDDNRLNASSVSLDDNRLLRQIQPTKCDSIVAKPAQARKVMKPTQVKQELIRATKCYPSTLYYIIFFFALTRYRVVKIMCTYSEMVL